MRFVLVLLLTLGLVSSAAAQGVMPVPAPQGVILIGTSGEPVSRTVFADGRPAVDGLAAMRDGAGWGFVDASGTWVVQPRYDDVRDFRDGRAAVKRGGVWGFIDRDGQEVIPPMYPEVRDFNEGFAAVRLPASRSGLFGARVRWAVVRRDGSRAHPATFFGAGLFQEGRIPVQVATGAFGLGRLWGYADTTGTLVLPPRFTSARSFSHGVALVQQGRSNALINASGDVLAPIDFPLFFVHVNGRARVSDGRLWGFLDERGQLTIPLRYTQALDFSEGLAAVSEDGQRWGYIDPSGAWAIPPSFSRATPFRGGLARVTLDGRVSVIDPTGRVLYSR